MADNKKLQDAESLCPVCMKKIPARFAKRGKCVYLEKSCAEHGAWSTLVWEDGPDFLGWDSGTVHSRPLKAAAKTEKGCPYDCGLCESHNQAACCVLIEITRRCNQNCPVCFASSGTCGDVEEDYSLEDMCGIFRFLREQSPERLFNIQISGGEPTLHPKLPEIVKMAKAHGFQYVQVNSNGRRLAEDTEYAVALRQAGADCIFLQFDGTNDEIYNAVRGEPLLETKQKAIQNAAAAGIGVILVVTVVPSINGCDIGNIIRFAADRLPQVRGVHFQPVSYFGRYPSRPEDCDRITIPGLIQRISEQTGGRMQVTDFIPLASGHGRCSFHGNFLVLEDGEYQGLSVDLGVQTNHDIEKARTYLARKWGAVSGRIGQTRAAESKAYDSQEWQALLDGLESSSMSITAMAFQDVWTMDLERLSRCRLHVVTRDLRIIPFCAFNITSESGVPLHERYHR